jgi:uncharacterized protein
MDLLDSEIRVLGALLEKQHTTPDAYPLTLNSLRLACNQATNRDPVVDYDDTILRDALQRLQRRGYARLTSSATSRTSKYRHLLADALPMDEGEQAVMCVLMLRGTQTPGELKQRSERMHAFAGLDAVQDTLQRLIARSLVLRLERRPGQKEERYAQQLGQRGESHGAAAPSATATVPPSVPPAAPQGTPPIAVEHHPSVAATTSAAAAVGAPAAELEARLARVERDLGERVSRLEHELSELRAQLGDSAAEPIIAALPPAEPTPEPSYQSQEPYPS